jgi:hypothetical protein
MWNDYDEPHANFGMSFEDLDINPNNNKKMAYNNNGGGYNNNRGGYNNNGGGYNNNRGGYNNNGGGGGYNNNRNAQPSKKHSGATTKKYFPKTGPNAGVEMIHTHGWMYRAKTGLVTYSCNTTSKSQLTDKGWIGSIACEVIHKGTGQKAFYWGTMEAKTGKVVIGDLGLVVSPKGGKGGYTGTFVNN